MITQLKLRNFRKHESLDINLGEGLQVLRGANEAGKTTLLEALAYALFGSKALRNSLSEVVTWGVADKELKVEVTLIADSQTYVFKRGKSGAEVITNGDVFVTGQNEVSAFASKLLGADAGTAAHLMMSGQGSLRGTLQEGPKATSALIESLANLDIIEQLIDAAQLKLQLGTTAVLEDRLKTATQTLIDLPVVEAPSVAQRDLALEGQATLLAAAKNAASVADAAYTKALDEFNAEDLKQKASVTLVAESARLQDQRTTTTADLCIAKAAASVVVEDPAPIEDLIRGAEDHTRLCAAWEAFQAVPSFDFSMSRNFYVEDFRRRSTVEKDLQSQYNALQTEIKVLESQRQTSTTCPSCGQDTAHLPSVQEKAAKVEADLVSAHAKVEEIKHADKLNDDGLNTLRQVKVADEEAHAALRNVGSQYMKVDDTTMPAIGVWTGPARIELTMPDVPALRQRLATIKAAISERDKAQGRVEALERTLSMLGKQIDDTWAKIAELGAVSTEAFHALNHAFIDAAAARGVAENDLAVVEDTITRINADFNTAQALWSEADAKRGAAQAQVELLTKDIETTQFNNALVKKLRAARPIIANKLWGMVLSTVSVMFGQMRGETSVVTKEKDGFQVNGRPVESLSGSTLDILGMAIRCALVKVFIPSCPFIILDEPSAACDADRSSALVGFIAAAGFQQVIMVTHDSTNEAMASNLIQL